MFKERIDPFKSFTTFPKHLFFFVGEVHIRSVHRKIYFTRSEDKLVLPFSHGLALPRGYSTFIDT